MASKVYDKIESDFWIWLYLIKMAFGGHGKSKWFLNLLHLMKISSKVHQKIKCDFRICWSLSKLLQKSICEFRIISKLLQLITLASEFIRKSELTSESENWLLKAIRKSKVTSEFVAPHQNGFERAFFCQSIHPPLLCLILRMSEVIYEWNFATSTNVSYVFLGVKRHSKYMQINHILNSSYGDQ